ncbi:MAG: glutaredoxin family protein [Azonexus sp.]
MPRLLIICLALACTGAFAETYRWVDSAGRIIVSDTPPPGKAQNVVKTGEGGENTDNQSFATKRAAENFPVTLFTSPDCVAECKQARDLLNGRGVPFSEKMIQKQEDVEELKKLVGDGFVPSLKVGKDSSRGMNASGYNNLLDLAGYPKTAPYGNKPAGGLSK